MNLLIRIRITKIQLKENTFKMKINLLISVLLMVVLNGYGQVDTIEPDTIKNIALEYSAEKNIESLGMKTVDSLNKPKAFILTSNIDPETIAIKAGNEFIVMNLIPAEWDGGHITKIERIQINGKGDKELVVFWEKKVGESDLANGWGEEFKKVLIYDLNTMNLIFEDQYSWIFETWTNEYTENRNVETTFITECYNYNLKLSNKKITKELKLSEACDNDDISEIKPKKLIYKLKKKNFVKMD